MPRYDVRNDGAGPYAAFYCDQCSREYRSQPDLKGTVAQSLGRDAVGGVLRNIPLFGRAVAENVTWPDPRYVTSLTPQQLEAAWQQVQQYFHTCPTCQQTVCPSCFDAQTGFCNEDSPRRAQIAQAEAEQAAGVVKGIASAFGLGDVLSKAGSAAKEAQARMARCPRDVTLAEPAPSSAPIAVAPCCSRPAAYVPNAVPIPKGASSAPNAALRSRRPRRRASAAIAAPISRAASSAPNVAPGLSDSLTLWRSPAAPEVRG